IRNTLGLKLGFPAGLLQVSGLGVRRFFSSNFSTARCCRAARGPAPMPSIIPLTVVVMMTMVAVVIDSMPVVPVVRRPIVVAIVPLIKGTIVGSVRVIGIS